MSPGLEQSGVAWCWVARCQLNIGPSQRRLGHRLDCLKDMSAHSLAPLGSAKPNWGCRLRTGIRYSPAALSPVSCWVMLIHLLALELQKAKPSEDCELDAEWEVLTRVGRCWQFVVNIQSRTAPLAICFIMWSNTVLNWVTFVNSLLSLVFCQDLSVRLGNFIRDKSLNLTGVPYTSAHYSSHYPKKSGYKRTENAFERNRNAVSLFPYNAAIGRRGLERLRSIPAHINTL